MLFFTMLSSLGDITCAILLSCLTPSGNIIYAISLHCFAPSGEYYLYYSSAMLNPGDKSCYCQLPVSLVHLYQRAGSLASRAFNDKDPVDRSHAGFYVRNTHSHRLFR